MKAQLRCNQVDEGRDGTQFHAGEVAVTRKIAFLQMPSDAQPVVGRLQWEVHVLEGFQLENGAGRDAAVRFWRRSAMPKKTTPSSQRANARPRMAEAFDGPGPNVARNDR